MHLIIYKKGKRKDKTHNCSNLQLIIDDQVPFNGIDSSYSHVSFELTLGSNILNCGKIEPKVEFL